MMKNRSIDLQAIPIVYVHKRVFAFFVFHSARTCEGSNIVCLECPAGERVQKDFVFCSPAMGIPMAAGAPTVLTHHVDLNVSVKVLRWLSTQWTQMRQCDSLSSQSSWISYFDDKMDNEKSRN